MQGTIHNRDEFLATISKRLGRQKHHSVVERPKYRKNPQDLTLKGASQDDLVKVLKEHCNNIHTAFVPAKKAELPTALKKVVEEYGGKSIVTWDDKRFQEYGIEPLLKEDFPNDNIQVHIWDPAKGKENVDFAEKANIGITISDITLAESATVVLLADKGKGRNVSFLPVHSIVIIPKSSVVPRMTQAARKLREKAKSGTVPSCINFISGPSNSADIELNLVVGVHGPVKATYILVEDL